MKLSYEDHKTVRVLTVSVRGGRRGRSGRHQPQVRQGHLQRQRARLPKGPPTPATDDRGATGIEDAEFMAGVFTKHGAKEVFSTSDPDEGEAHRVQVPAAGDRLVGCEGRRHVPLLSVLAQPAVLADVRQMTGSIISFHTM